MNRPQKKEVSEIATLRIRSGIESYNKAIDEMQKWIEHVIDEEIEREKDCLKEWIYKNDIDGQNNYSYRIRDCEKKIEILQELKQVIIK